MTQSLHLQAPAKLNLLLNIIGRRADGYHKLQMIMQLIDFYDELTFTPQANHDIVLKCDNPVLANHDNLIYRAACFLQQQFKVKQGITINLVKKIAIGSGMGGGSSDCATTLVALNKLWQLHLSNQQLREIALQFGADVPFFVFAKNAVAEGIGEKLSAIELPTPWFIIVIPPVAVTTSKIYNDPRLTRDSTPITIRALPKTCHNDMQTVATLHYPVIGDVISQLSVYTPAQMTGSGCAVFGQCVSLADAKTIAKRMPPQWQVIIAQGLTKSPLYDFAY